MLQKTVIYCIIKKKEKKADVNMGSVDHGSFEKILFEELVPAMGCTEPIALAYGTAYAVSLLGALPAKIDVCVSGNLVKNAKSVTVPNTDGLSGIEAAVAAGAVSGKPEAKLEVLAALDDKDRESIRKYLSENRVSVTLADTELSFDFTVRASAGAHTAVVRIINAHTNVVYAELDGNVLLDASTDGEECDGMSDHGFLSVEGIVEYVNDADIDSVRQIIERQIEYNTAISDEGLKNPWGASIGSTLLSYANAPVTKAKARASAASDARMNGCPMPVIILSGSGNQGITACLPVVSYAEDIGADREKLIRAVLLSDLITLHLKSSIGRLSAFCGAVCAGVGAGAGICYLEGGGFNEIAHTVVNAIAISSGIICDGAKSSCSGKIALAVEAGILGWQMYKNGKQFHGGEGIITKGVENTIKNMGLLGNEGMKETDRMIMEIMLHS